MDLMTEELKRELLRKLLHAAVVVGFIPIAAVSKGILILVIVGGLVLYLFYESYVARGGSLPLVTKLVDKIKRFKETEIAHAPFIMGAGIILTVIAFPFRPATAGFLQLAVCDMVATLAGKKWGRHPLPHAPEKTLEGSLAFFLVAALMMPFLYPLPGALLLAFVGAAIESLPYKDWDNFLIPVSVAAVASLI